MTTCVHAPWFRRRTWTSPRPGLLSSAKLPLLRKVRQSATLPLNGVIRETCREGVRSFEECGCGANECDAVASKELLN